MSSMVDLVDFSVLSLLPDFNFLILNMTHLMSNSARGKCDSRGNYYADHRTKILEVISNN